MILNVICVLAAVALASSGRVDHEQLNRQVEQQQEMIQQQNERIRDHQRLESQQRAEQLRDLEEQRQRQSQLINEQEQQRREHIRANGHIFIAAQPHFFPASIQFVTVPSSRRHFEVRDDSNYNFGYSVSDLTTGDVKSQQETRRGDQVQGQYSMMDSDGYQRVVDYRADDDGFDAEVSRREPPAAAIVAAPHFVRIDGSNNYAPQFFHRDHHQPASYQYFVTQAHPTIYSTTSVSRRDDGQRNQYTATTASNF